MSIPILSPEPTSDALLSEVCECCQAMSDFFTPKPKRTEYYDLGTFEEAAKSTCSQHMPLVRAFIAHYDGNIERWHSDTPFRKQLKIGRAHQSGYDGGVLQIGRDPMGWDLLLVQEDSDESLVLPRKGVLVDPEWVDIDRVKACKDLCLNEHGLSCQNPLKIWHVRPQFLINVADQCIVPGSNIDSYVALSYVWGAVEQLRATIDNIDELQKSQSLKTTQFSPLIAPVIHRAMHLTAGLGEKFLWVDALCVIQGAAGKAKEFEAMGAIYANATLTIIAGDGDAQSALSGLKGVSRPRQFKQRCVQYGGERFITRNEEFPTWSADWQLYNSRGWTYQECRLSKRRLIFNAGKIRWECQSSEWHEDLVVGAELRPYIDTRLRICSNGFPDLSSLESILAGYTGHSDFTFTEDTLPAISGLLAVVSRSFAGGFLFGLPEMLFDWALCWGSLWASSDITRREATAAIRSDQRQTQDHVPPSWSMLGWRGPFSWVSGPDFIKHGPYRYATEPYPITQWYTADSPTSRERRLIQSSWFQKQEDYKSKWLNPDSPLPPGWTRHDPVVDAKYGPDLPLLRPEGCGYHLFRHRDFPAVPDRYKNDLWFYPFPVMDITSETPPYTPQQTRYLFCETRKAYLWASPTIEEGKRWGMNADLQGKSGEVVGHLYLHNEQQHFRLFGRHRPSAHIIPARVKIELVAICRTRRQEIPFKDNPDQESLIITDFIDVLWVEWRDGVAYRLCSGQVEKQFWEVLPLQDISLCLG